MAIVYRFPIDDERRPGDIGARDGRALLRDLIDALQVLALTKPEAVETIAGYARFIINSR